jgi:hypothetical protein
LVVAKVDRRGVLREHYTMGNLAPSRLAAALVLALGLVLMGALASTRERERMAPETKPAKLRPAVFRV